MRRINWVYSSFDDDELKRLEAAVEEANADSRSAFVREASLAKAEKVLNGDGGAEET